MDPLYYLLISYISWENTDLFPYMKHESSP